MNRRNFLTTSAAAGLSTTAAQAAEASNQYIELRSFQLRNSPANQSARMQEFLEEHHLPMTRRNEFGPVGYFQVHLGADMPRLIMVIAYDSLADLQEKLARKSKDKKWTQAADSFGAADRAPFVRIENWLLQAFDGMPKLQVPETSEDKPPRLFDLRTYQAETYRDVREKIRMFNEEEIAIFRKVGVNPVFFGETLFGTKIPNLTYMVWYDDMDAREAAWGKFLADPDWERISSKPEWANSEIVSNISNTHLRPLPFSPIR